MFPANFSQQRYRAIVRDHAIGPTFYERRLWNHQIGHDRKCLFQHVQIVKEYICVTNYKRIGLARLQKRQQVLGALNHMRLSKTCVLHATLVFLFVNEVATQAEIISQVSLCNSFEDLSSFASLAEKDGSL